MKTAETKSDWMSNPPNTLEGKLLLLKERSSTLKSPTHEGTLLRRILQEVEREFEIIHQQARNNNPLAFFKPSYEQALLLNAWVYGISFLLIFTANRIGKTAASIVDKLLWIFPNDPKWPMFTPYIDHIGRKVNLLPRPHIDTRKRIQYALRIIPEEFKPNPRESIFHPQNESYLQWLQTKLPANSLSGEFPDAPWPRGGVIWQGAQDHDAHKKMIFPEWHKWIPSKSILRYSPDDKELTFEVQSGTRKITWEVYGKSYETKDTKWASGAVDMIGLTEGVPQRIFNEVKLRFKDPGVGSWDYTPYEATNLPGAGKLARDVYTGKEKLPLSPFVFTEFSIRNAPQHIVSKEKREEIISSFENLPEGKARIDGQFFATSSLVLSNLNREINCLTWSKDDLFKRYPNARLYRGLDPGIDHPTACVWAALLPSNVWVVYRILSERGLSIAQRCKRIIELSGNTVSQKRYGSGENDHYLVETHGNSKSEIVTQTFCDYHTFKVDETTGRSYAHHYTINGLVITESTHVSPVQRTQLVDQALLTAPYSPHPETHITPSPKLFFLINEFGVAEFIEKMENYYWPKKLSGEDRGAPKDTLPDHDDDELDGVGYLVGSPVRWTNHGPSARLSQDSEAEFGVAKIAADIHSIQGQTSHFATVAKGVDVPSVAVFGEDSDDEDDDELFDEMS